MREAFDELRSAINEIEAAKPGARRTKERVQSLSTAVDHLRTKVWAYLTTHQEGDLNRYLAEIRIRRATEACEDVIANLQAATIDRSGATEHLERALRELHEVCLARGPK